MALERTFADLQRHLRILQEALEALGTTVDEDKPTRDDVVVASRLSDDLLAIRGLLEEALGAADDACRATIYPLDGERARRALTTCQQHFHRFAHSFSFELACYDRMDDLSTVGRERGQEWLHRPSLAHTTPQEAQTVDPLSDMGDSLPSRCLRPPF